MAHAFVFVHSSWTLKNVTFFGIILKCKAKVCYFVEWFFFEFQYWISHFAVNNIQQKMKFMKLQTKNTQWLNVIFKKKVSIISKVQTPPSTK